MNALVLIALKRPYTFVVLAILILVFGGRAAMRTPTDVFPNIGIPVVAVVWTYNGLTPADMSGRMVYYYERALTTTVSNIEHIEHIEHIESQSRQNRELKYLAKQWRPPYFRLCVHVQQLH